MGQPQFGERLWQAMQQVKANTGRNLGAIKQDLAELCSVTVDAVDKWKSRRVPGPDTVEHLARWAVETAGMEREWLSAFLREAEYYDDGALIQDFFDDDPATLPVAHDNLPPLRSDFIGRAEEIERVLEGLAMPHPLISIEGMGGVGKTTLAIKVARLCLAGEIETIQPFQTIVWISAIDKPNRDLSLGELLDSAADMLNYPVIHSMSDEKKRRVVDKLLRSHRTLIIVDNFETITDAKLADFLQRIPPPSKGLITTRERQLRRLWDVPLAGLADAEAIKKIRDHSYSLGLRAIAHVDEKILQPLVAITAGNPKALEMALGYIKHQDMSLDEVIRSLAEANETVETLFDDLFSRAWDVLPGEGQNLLMAMPFFAGSVSREALECAADVHGWYLRAALSQLIELSLLETNEELVETRKRYAAHPLVLAFAQARLKEHPAFEAEARQRWGKYFVQFAERHLKRELPQERYWNTLQGRDLAIVNPEKANLLKTLAWAAEQEKDHLLIELMMRWTHYLAKDALADRLHYAQQAADAAGRLDQKVDEALLRIDALGWVYIEIGHFAEATREINAGLAIVEALPADSEPANNLKALAYSFLARVYLAQNQVSEAAAWLDAAMSIDCAAVIRHRVLLDRARLASSQNDYATALYLHEEEMNHIRDLYGGDYPMVETHYSLGNIYLNLGDVTQAEIQFKAVIVNADQISVFDLNHGQYGLARVAAAKGDIVTARQLAQKVFDTLSELDVEHRLLEQVKEFLKKIETTSEGI